MTVETVGRLYYGIALPDFETTKPKSKAYHWEGFMEDKGIKISRAIQIISYGNAFSGDTREALAAWAQESNYNFKVELPDFSKFDEALIEAAKAMKVAKKFHKPGLYLALYTF